MTSSDKSPASVREALAAALSTTPAVQSAAQEERVQPPAATQEEPTRDEMMDMEFPPEQCEIPPLGWRCTRAPGHEGPCAAVPAPEDVGFVLRGMARLRAAEAIPSPAAPTAPVTTVEDERARYEAQFPKPEALKWTGAEYELVDRDCVNSYFVDRWVGGWRAWLARAALSTAAVKAAEVPLSNDEALDQIQHVFEHDEWREQAWEHGILMETNDNELAARVKAHANRYVAELIAAAPAQGKAAE